MTNSHHRTPIINQTIQKASSNSFHHTRERTFPQAHASNLFLFGWSKNFIKKWRVCAQFTSVEVYRMCLVAIHFNNVCFTKLQTNKINPINFRMIREKLPAGGIEALEGRLLVSSHTHTHTYTHTPINPLSKLTHSHNQLTHI